MADPSFRRGLYLKMSGGQNLANCLWDTNYPVLAWWLDMGSRYDNICLKDNWQDKILLILIHRQISILRYLPGQEMSRKQKGDQQTLSSTHANLKFKHGVPLYRRSEGLSLSSSQQKTMNGQKMYRKQRTKSIIETHNYVDRLNCSASLYRRTPCLRFVVK